MIEGKSVNALSAAVVGHTVLTSPAVSAVLEAIKRQPLLLASSHDELYGSVGRDHQTK